MSLVDLLVLAVVALAALRGWRRGGTGLVLRAALAAGGVLGLGALARWWDPTSAPLAIGAVLVGALVGWAVGRRVAAQLARGGDGRPRRPGLPDRALGVVAHGALALVVLLTLAAVVGAVGPPSVANAAGRSGVLAVAGERLPTAGELLPAAVGVVR